MLTNAPSSPRRSPRAITAAQPTPEFHPLSIMRMLWKRKFQVLLVWIVLCAVSVAVVYRLPPVYEASATILVDSQKIPDKFVTSTVSTEIEDRLATLRKEILSGPELLKIVNELDLYHDARKKAPEEEIVDMMSKDTKVTLERGWTKDRPGAFKVSYQGTDPRAVANVANKIANLFIKKNLDSRAQRAGDTTVFLSEKLDEAKKSLENQEKKVTQYKLQFNGQLPEQEASLGSTLSRLHIELQGNQDAINRAQQNRVMLENAISSTESSIATLVAMTEQPALPRPSGAGVSTTPLASPTPDGQPQKASDVLQAKLEGMRLRYGDDHPEIKRLRGEIERLREMESKTASRASQAAERQPQAGNRPPDAGTAQPTGDGTRAVSPAFAEELVKERERLGSLRAQLSVANKELENRAQERQSILVNVKTYESRLANLPVRQQQMAGLTRDYEISKENYRSLLDKKIAAEMASDMENRQQGEKFTLLEPAIIPQIPIKPKRALLTAAGCVLGLLISLVTAGAQEMKNGTVLGEWELPADIAVLGRVPLISMQLYEWAEPDDGAGGGLKRGWRLALVSSALLSLAGVIAALYLGWAKV